MKIFIFQFSLSLFASEVSSLNHRNKWTLDFPAGNQVPSNLGFVRWRSPDEIKPLHSIPWPHSRTMWQRNICHNPLELGTGDSAEPSLLSDNSHRTGVKVWIQQQWEALSSLHRNSQPKRGDIYPPPLTQYTRAIVLLAEVDFLLVGWAGRVGWAWQACRSFFSHHYPQHIHFLLSWAFLASFYWLDLIFIITLKRPSAI